MEHIKYKDKGSAVRYGLRVKQGIKYDHIIILNHFPLRVTKIPISERKYITVLNDPDKAVSTLTSIAGQYGANKQVSNYLNLKENTEDE